MSDFPFPLPPIPPGGPLGQMPDGDAPTAPPSLLVLLADHVKYGMQPVAVIDSRDPEEVAWAFFIATTRDDLSRYDFAKTAIQELPYYPIAALERFERAVAGKAWAGEPLVDPDAKCAPGVTSLDTLKVVQHKKYGPLVYLPLLNVWGYNREGGDEMTPLFVSDAEHRNDMARVMALHDRNGGWPADARSRVADIAVSCRLTHKQGIESSLFCDDEPGEDPGDEADAPTPPGPR